MIWAADACERLGHVAAAAPVHELLSPFGGVMVAHAGPISVALGRLALVLERPEESEHHFREAIELCERMDAKAYLAIARRDLASCCFRRMRR